MLDHAEHMDHSQQQTLKWRVETQNMSEIPFLPPSRLLLCTNLIIPFSCPSKMAAKTMCFYLNVR